jgi:hypothetical protein
MALQSAADLRVFDSTYPVAHLVLDKHQPLAPRWVSQHLTLYTFPKVFPSRANLPSSKLYTPRPYSNTPRRPEQNIIDMSI